MVTREVIDEAILQTTQKLHPLQASGPDGMHAMFYQKRWHIIGKVMIPVISSFLQHSHLLKD